MTAGIQTIMAAASKVGESESRDGTRKEIQRESNMSERSDGGVEREALLYVLRAKEAYIALLVDRFTLRGFIMG